MRLPAFMSLNLKKTLLVLLGAALLPILLKQAPERVLAQNDTPLMFIENVGQFPVAGYVAYSGQSTILVAEDGIWLTLLDQSPAMSRAEAEAALTAGAPVGQGVAFKISFIDANPQPRMEPFQPLDAHMSFLTGKESTTWRTNVPVWGGIRYVELYPGLDLEITSKNGQLVQRLVVNESDVSIAQLGAAVEPVQIQIEGTEQIFVENNQLRLSSAVGEVGWPLLEIVGLDGNPLEIPATPVEVNSDGQVLAPFATALPVEPGFAAQPVAIAGASDLLYSTFMGGTGNLEYGLGLDIDAAGYAYVTGQADFGFPSTPGVFDPTIEGVYNDVFVAKLSPDGSDLIFATFLGGSDWETSYGLNVGPSGEIYVAGHTTSADFPTTPGAFDSALNGPGEAFVVKLNATGTDLIYATLFGGSDSDFGWDLAVDEAGNAHVTGTTSSADFPVTPGAFDETYEQGDAFVVKFNSDGSDLLYGTFIGGNGFESGYGIAINANGQAVAVGSTGSTDFPITPGAADATQAQSDGYVVALTSDGTSLLYSTFVGGSQYDSAEALALDAAGYAYVTGNTRSPDFPLSTDAFSTDCDNCEASLANVSSFVTKISPDGSTFAYSSFLGGSQPDYGLAIDVSAAGSAYVTGYTYSANFPVTPDAFDTVCESCAVDPFNRPDVFVSRVNSSGTALAYSTFLGGDAGLNGQGGAEWGAALAVDDGGNVYITGPTSTTDFPITMGAYDILHEGYYDVFVSKLFTGSDDPEPEPLPLHSCAPTSLGEIMVGSNPRGVAVDPQRERVYVANYGSNSVSVIDGSSNTVLGTINNIPAANGIAYDATNNIIWVTNYQQNTLTPIQANADASDFTLLPAISVGNGPWGVAVDPVHNYVYVANSLDSSVSVVDAASQGVVTTLINTFNQPFHLAAHSEDGKIYVANRGHNSVSIIQGTGVIKEVQLWDSGRPYGIAVDETRDVVYVATIEKNRIVAIGSLNGQSDEFLGWASFQRGYNRFRPLPLRVIAVNPALGAAGDGGHVWATTATVDGSEADQALFIPKGWSSRFHVPFAEDVGLNPTDGIAVDRLHNRVYISADGTPGTITVMGDHSNVCSGIAPASVPSDDDGFSLERFSMAELLAVDVIGDGQIDILDLTFVAARYGTNDLAADVNGDGQVDIADLVRLAHYFGQRVPRQN